jgi:hypothetical protein
MIFRVEEVILLCRTATLFEMAVHISGWARAVHAEYFLSLKLGFEVMF